MVKPRDFLVSGSNATAVLCAVATESMCSNATAVLCGVATESMAKEAGGASSFATRPMGNVDPTPYLIGRRASETVSRL